MQHDPNHPHADPAADAQAADERTVGEVSDPRESSQHPVLANVHVPKALAVEAVCTLMQWDALDLMEMLFAKPDTVTASRTKKATVRR